MVTDPVHTPLTNVVVVPGEMVTGVVPARAVKFAVPLKEVSVALAAV